MLCAKLAQVLLTRPPTWIWSVPGFPQVKKNIVGFDFGLWSERACSQRKTPRAIGGAFQIKPC
jgi:hypothetical protein